MDKDETTTVEPIVEETAVEETQAVEQEDNTAESTETTTEESTEEPDKDTSEEDLSDWASKKGIDLTTPEGQAKALKSMRESEKSFHNKAQEASELAKQINKTDIDPNASSAERALAIANNLNNQQIINSWVNTAQVPVSDLVAMKEYGAANPHTEQLLENGSISLDEYRAIAVAAKPVDTEAIKKLGGQEALQTLANKQRATAVKGSASSSQSSSSLTKDNVDEWYSNLGPEGRKNPANQATLERILAS